ncbi:MAG: glycosyltransferase [Akkermansiaceae bacterium]|nr:glycosyltransferase [Akkermansiaceae bacterium]
MNRAPTAIACVKALAAQTRPPELVVVADNVSVDRTVAELEALPDLPFELVVHRMKENRGNAGGVEEAMELAFSKGADAVWILDDDSWPRPEAMAELTKNPWDPNVVRHTIQIDPKTGAFTWPMQVIGKNGNWEMVDRVENLPAGDPVHSRIMWTGALLPREVRETAGPVMGDLFIRGEDEEYPWRFEQAGFRQEAVRGAILDHPGPERLVEWKFLGKKLFFEPGLADWKLYYKVRNMVWLKRRQQGMAQAMAMGTAYALAASRIDGIRRLPLICEALKDGWAGRLGRWEKHPR